MVNPKFIPYAQVSLSMGISAYPNDGHTMNEIIEKADEALYIAKSRGKITFIFTNKRWRLGTFLLPHSPKLIFIST